jgi:hypothetical protein
MSGGTSAKELQRGNFEARNLLQPGRSGETVELTEITQVLPCPLQATEARGHGIKTYRLIVLIVVIAYLAILPVRANAQSPSKSPDSTGEATTAVPLELGTTYTRPSEATKLHNFVLDMVGPYTLVGVAAVAGIDQYSNAPPEWKQGAEGYGKRFGSTFGVAAVSTTTRYGLGEVLREDTLYYRCECRGILPRLGHAVLTSFTARRGEDGHRAFAISSLVAPYAGTMTAVYAWYPNRFGAEDAFRMGNYNLLLNVGENVLLELIYGGPHSLGSRMHLGNPRGARDNGSTP